MNSLRLVSLVVNVIGVDPSLRRTGIACLTDEQEESFVVDLADEPDNTARSFRIAAVFSGALRRHDPDVVCIESYAFSAARTGGTARLTQIAEAVGLLKYLAIAHGASVIMATPGTIKKFATGNGRAEKHELALAAFKKWGLKVGKDYDRVDAYCVAKYGRAYMTNRGRKNANCSRSEWENLTAGEYIPASKLQSIALQSGTPPSDDG